MSIFSARIACTTVLAASLTAALPAYAASENVLYSFQGSTDGDEPFAGLTNVKGTLYGTTYGNYSQNADDATVFKLTTTGVKTILYTFAGNPVGPLLLAT